MHGNGSPRHGLESGDFVVVYHDHLTRQDAEGLAQLVELCELPIPEFPELWTVEFLATAERKRRWVDPRDWVWAPRFPVKDIPFERGCLNV